MTTYSSDSFADAATGGWGNDDQANAWATTGGVAGDYSVAGGIAIAANMVANGQRAGYVSIGQTDMDVTLKCRFSQVTTSALCQLSLMGRYNGSTTAYRASARIQTSGAVDLRTETWITGTLTTIGTDVTNVGTGKNGTEWWHLRLQLQGTSPTAVRAKLWLDGGAEPGSWQIDITDTNATLQTSGGAGIRGFLGAAYSGSTSQLEVDDWLARSIPVPGPGGTPALLLGGL